MCPYGPFLLAQSQIFLTNLLNNLVMQYVLLLDYSSVNSFMLLDVYQTTINVANPAKVYFKTQVALATVR